MHKLIYYINNHILTITLIGTAILILTVISLANYKKIIKFINFTKNLVFIIRKIINEPILFGLKNLLFDVKKFFLEYKLALVLKNKNNQLLCAISFNLFLLFLFIIFLVKVVYSYNTKYDNILLMLDGAIISIWITNCIQIYDSINSYAKNLNRTFTTLTSMLQVLSSLYELFIPLFPYDDALFKKGNDILYITPYGYNNEVVLQKDSTSVFINYFQSLNQEQLLKSYDENKAREMANLLLKYRQSFYAIHSFISTSIEYLPDYIVDLFEQVYSLVDKIINFHSIYQSFDESLKKQSSILYSTYIYKLSVTIIILQEEKILYKEYINHISNPPKVIFAKTLDEAIKINKKNKNLK